VGCRPHTTRPLRLSSGQALCFGKRDQNHFRPCAALRVPPPPSRIRVHARITFPVWVLRRLSGKARGLRMLLGRATPPDRMNRRPNWGSYSCANPKMARELAALKQPSPRGRFGAAAPPRTKAGIHSRNTSGLENIGMGGQNSILTPDSTSAVFTGLKTSPYGRRSFQVSG